MIDSRLREGLKDTQSAAGEACEGVGGARKQVCGHARAGVVCQETSTPRVVVVGVADVGIRRVLCDALGEL